MEDKKVIQAYIDNFRFQLSGLIKPEIGIDAVVFPCKEEGAIIEFLFGKDKESTNEFKESFARISDALGVIEQKAFGGDLEAFRFSGTNYIMEFHRLILIKDNAPSEWTMKQAHDDALKFITAGKK